MAELKTDEQGYIDVAAIEEGARREEEEKRAAFLAEQERRRQAAEERNAAIMGDMMKALDLGKTEREEQMKKEIQKARETAAQQAEAELRRKYGLEADDAMGQALRGLLGGK